MFQLKLDFLGGKNSIIVLFFVVTQFMNSHIQRHYERVFSSKKLLWWDARVCSFDSIVQPRIRFAVNFVGHDHIAGLAVEMNEVRYLHRALQGIDNATVFVDVVRDDAGDVNPILAVLRDRLFVNLTSKSGAIVVFVLD